MICIQHVSGKAILTCLIPILILVGVIDMMALSALRSLFGLSTH